MQTVHDHKKFNKFLQHRIQSLEHDKKIEDEFLIKVKSDLGMKEKQKF
jgi:hypothetical protein